jgi:hypothetical protein
MSAFSFFRFSMASGADTNPNTTTNATLAATEPKRKVSILEEPKGFDNAAYEAEARNRKISNVKIKTLP